MKTQSNVGLQKDVGYIKEKVDAIEKKLEQNYVTKDELLLVKQECMSKIDTYKDIKTKVDIIIGLILTTVIGAVLKLVIK